MQIHSDKNTVVIRKMSESDALIFYNKFLSQNWHPDINTYMNYYAQQEENKRIVLVAEYNSEIAGFINILPKADEGPFYGTDYPLLSDFNVFEKYQRNGVGSALMDAAESKTAEYSDTVVLAVGLHSGYGSAQRMYIKRGYIPDGSGVWCNGKCHGQYMPCCNDDSLLLWFYKKLK